MDRLRARIERALAGVDRAERPEAPPPSGLEIHTELEALFEAELDRARGRLVRVPDEATALGEIAALADGAPFVRAEDDPTEAALRDAAIGVDRADLLIAETGTVVRTFPSREAARVTLVPPVIAFLARRQALVRDFPATLRQIQKRHETGRAYTVFITGPSRTADIEKILILGAHGPKRLVVLLVD